MKGNTLLNRQVFFYFLSCALKIYYKTDISIFLPNENDFGKKYERSTLIKKKY